MIKNKNNKAKMKNKIPKLKNNKRAASESLDWVIKFIYLSAAMIVIFLLISAFVSTKVETRQAESAIIAKRMLFSPTGIIYFDKGLNRVYPGIIDLEKFTDKRLDESLFLKNNQAMAAKLTLYDMDNKKLKEAFFNKEWYERLIPLKAMPGTGGSDAFNEKDYVLVKDQDKFKPAILEIDLVFARE